MTISRSSKLGADDVRRSSSRARLAASRLAGAKFGDAFVFESFGALMA
jgi:hypothetical protein